MAPPLLVIEIVSPGELQRDRDYIAKRMQYQDRGIPEYWVVDPQLHTILLLALHNDEYGEVATFRGTDPLYSSQLGLLNLATAQVFATGQSDA
jgi:Uma2 family endonuclease